MKTYAVILAAGQGTRMNSNLPKVLHPILGKPMLAYPLEAAQRATHNRPLVVVGHGAQQVQQTFANAADFVLQSPQLGTGHAVLQAASTLQHQADLVLVLPGDLPLLTEATFSRLIAAQSENPGPLTIVTAIAQQPRNFGRILRQANGSVAAIVEEAQATPEQRAIREVNVGIYCFRAEWLWQNLTQIPLSPKGEYYITDLIGMAVSQRLPVQAFALEDEDEFIGVNTRIHLADAARAMQRRIQVRLMLDGVTLINPESIYIEPGVSIGKDTVIWGNTYLHGNTQIGEACEIGPNSILHDTRVGNHCTILASVLEKAVLEDHVEIGPFGHLRKGAHLANGVHMGNFGEVKNSYLGPGVKMGHFSYIGDATIGAETNIGAGTITCNYDGKNKHHTEIGEGVFIGSDTMLVAPLNLGAGARTGAGSVVTKDIPAHALAVGVPARVIRKLETNE